jgi:transcription initiation factor TFIID subunit 5
LLLPSHVQNDELAQRFRNEKYIIRMSRSGFGLLIGWLTEGMGGEGTGAGDGFSGEKGKRGRATVLQVVNNHLRFDGKYVVYFISFRCSLQIIVTSSSSTAVSPNSWEESTGLLSSLIPQNKNSATIVTDPHSFNAASGYLKLGPASYSEELQTVIKEQAMIDRELNTPYDVSFSLPTPLHGATSPAISELLPHPPTFKTSDVKREIEKVRDERKRIRLDPSVLTAAGVNSPAAAAVRSHALPSICAYTLHDVPEGCVDNLRLQI